jgi:aminopeptidase N
MWQQGQERLTDPYVGRYFEVLPLTADVRTGWLLAASTGYFFPRWSVTPATVASAHAMLERDDLDPMIRRDLVDETWDLERRLAVVQTFHG